MTKQKSAKERATLNERSIVNIVSAFATRKDVNADDIVKLIDRLNAEFSEDSPSEEVSTDLEVGQKTALRAVISKSDAVTHDKVYCMCCGRGFAMLKRHLGAEHDLSEFEYREMFSLPEDFPLVAPSYSERKAAHAKRVGLGKHVRDQKVTPVDR